MIQKLKKHNYKLIVFLILCLVLTVCSFETSNDLSTLDLTDNLPVLE